MKFEIAMLCRVGDRKVNEDCADYQVTDKGVVAVLCDGLGGHSHGEVASRSFVETTIAQHAQLLRADYASAEQTEKKFTALFNQGANRLREATARMDLKTDARTTAVVAILREDISAVAHVGDSRGYRLRGDKIVWRTRDHSLVQMWVDEGEISEEEMGTHPDQGKLLKSLDVEWDDKPAVTVATGLQSKEAFLLCSDGFWERLTGAEIVSLASANDLSKRLDELATLAEQRAKGRSDNVTALCVRPLKGGVLTRLKQWFS